MSAAMEPPSCCGGKRTPGPGVPAKPLECCKIKVADPLAKADSAKPAAAKLQLPLPVLVRVSALPPVEALPTAFADGHGPPGSFSFAETVLQRSLLSHAPPLAV